MKFYVDQEIKSGQRIGALCDFKSNPLLRIETPAVLLHTQGGQMHHVTHEVLKLVTTSPQILQIPLAGVHTFREAMRHFNGSISDFIGSGESLSCVTLQDPCNVTRHGHNSTLKVPIWTKQGKVYYDPTTYMDAIESFEPNMYTLLSDGDTNAASSEKRISRSVNNTISFYKVCIERHRNSDILKEKFVIAPIVGGYKPVARDKCIDALKPYLGDIGGFLLDGLHNNGPETEFLEVGEVQPLIEHIVEKLPEDKLRMIQGCWNPVSIIKMVELGVDLFDSSYCHILTERSAAMTFAIDKDDDPNLYEINMRSDKNADDFQPIMQGCKCLACMKYTRAYIHHLLLVQELLGPLLIMIHNIHHFLEFFKKIRLCIRNNTLQSFQVRIEEQFRSFVKLNKGF